MTIKEVEACTGLARANIRYYEEQGFFTADRGENGYRNYAEEHVDILLKIKLLRQLGFSLEEIHELQRGERSLEPALEQREAALEQERRELDQAARLCRDMRSDGANFYTLDARRYLDRLAREEEIVAQDQDPVRVFPWRRYFARTVDMQLCVTLLTLALQLFGRANVVRLDQNAGSSFLLKLGALVLLFGMETLALHFFGATPGKALLGLKVLREDGSRLGLDEAAWRTASVVAFFGFSLLLMSAGIPLIVLGGAAMLVWACWQASHERRLFWESDQLYLDGSTREASFWEKRGSWWRVAGYLAASAACVGLMVAGHFLAARPPHRGADITAEEFVENYNQYMNFAYGQANLSRRLTAEGVFEEVPQEGNSVVIDIMGLMGEEKFPDPFFKFSPGSGPVEQVILTRQYESREPLRENSSYFVSVPYGEIYAAMRSLLYGRLGERRLDALYKELVEAGGSLHSELDGVRIHSEARFSGYSAWGEDTLFAKAGQTQSYFVEFTMTLT